MFHRGRVHLFIFKMFPFTFHTKHVLSDQVLKQIVYGFFSNGIVGVNTLYKQSNTYKGFLVVGFDEFLFSTQITLYRLCAVP